MVSETRLPSPSRPAAQTPAASCGFRSRRFWRFHGSLGRGWFVSLGSAPPILGNPHILVSDYGSSFARLTLHPDRRRATSRGLVTWNKLGLTVVGLGIRCHVLRL